MPTPGLDKRDKQRTQAQIANAKSFWSWAVAVGVIVVSVWILQNYSMRYAWVLVGLIMLGALTLRPDLLTKFAGFLGHANARLY